MLPGQNLVELFLMKKKRILYIESNRDGTVGGSYYSLFYLVRGLDKDLYQPVVMFYEDNPLIGKFRELAIEVVVYDHYSPSDGRIRNLSDFVKFLPRLVRDVLWGHFKVIKKLDEINPDIVHLNNSYAVNHDWVLACKRRGVKIIAHDRGTRPPASLQTRFFVRFLDAIISVSDSYLKYVTEQKLKPKTACRIYNGLDVTEFADHYHLESKKQIRRNLNVSNGDILIGMVGNIDYWKGQIVLVKAMSLVVKEFKNVKVALVGKTARGAAKYEEEIRACISQHGLNDNIIFTGYREDIPALLNAFDIFVHASVEPEPFGRVILEAMAMKKPIVATNAGGPPEIIVDGKSGLLVPMDDERAMADAILIYLDDRQKADELGINAWTRLQDKFSTEKMVSAIEDIYQKIFSL